MGELRKLQTQELPIWMDYSNLQEQGLLKKDDCSVEQRPKKMIYLILKRPDTT